MLLQSLRAERQRTDTLDKLLTLEPVGFRVVFAGKACRHQHLSLVNFFRTKVRRQVVASQNNKVETVRAASVRKLGVLRHNLLSDSECGKQPGIQPWTHVLQLAHGERGRHKDARSEPGNALCSIRAGTLENAGGK